MSSERRILTADREGLQALLLQFAFDNPVSIARCDFRGIDMAAYHDALPQRLCSFFWKLQEISGPPLVASHSSKT
jgi:hypothetical protein